MSAFPDSLNVFELTSLDLYIQAPKEKSEDEDLNIAKVNDCARSFEVARELVRRYNEDEDRTKRVLWKESLDEKDRWVLDVCGYTPDRFWNRVRDGMSRLMDSGMTKAQWQATVRHRQAEKHGQLNLFLPPTTPASSYGNTEPRRDDHRGHRRNPRAVRGRVRPDRIDAETADLAVPDVESGGRKRSLLPQGGHA